MKLSRMGLWLGALTLGISATAQTELRYDSLEFYNIYKTGTMIETLVKASGGDGYAYREGAFEMAKIGDYKQVLAYWDKGGYIDDVLLKEDSAAFRAFVPADARNYILEQAKYNRVVIINEASHIPAHRAFILALLPKLRESGFTHYASDGLSTYDLAGIQQRGYPVRHAISGNYTDEPLCGDIVRQAVKLGMTLVAYEQYDGECAKQFDTKTCAQRREEAQANALTKILLENPNAKILVHCGYGHLDERADLPIPMMAAKLQQASGINPLTIDQERMTEKSAKTFEDPIYTLATESNSFKKPSIFLQNDSIRYNREAGYADIQVFHPRTTYTNNRPDYLTMYGMRKRTPINTQKLKPGQFYLIQAFPKGEDTFFGVPIDQLEVTDPTQKYDLCLPLGSYVVLVIGENGKEVSRSTLDVVPTPK